MRRQARRGGRGGGVRQFVALVAAGVLLSTSGGEGLSVQYDPILQYGPRGDHYEGLRAVPVGGSDIALLGAHVDYREDSSEWPQSLHLRFYLPPDEESVHVTVRQLRSRSTYYWLDRVLPSAPWAPGNTNEFTWATAPVLARLSSLTLDDLGAVIRLRRPDPGTEEFIAPTVLYHSKAPTEVVGYRFTLKTNARARITCRFYRTGSDSLVHERAQNWERAGSPFTVRWNSTAQPDDWYRLVISGYFANDNTPVHKEINFYHRASLGAEEGV